MIIGDSTLILSELWILVYKNDPFIFMGESGQVSQLNKPTIFGIYPSRELVT